MANSLLITCRLDKSTFTSVINADTVDSVALLSSAFPARFGYRSGSVLDLNTRDGNRLKPGGHFAAAMSGVGRVVDGPFDSGRGAYLFAARKSYLGYLVLNLFNRHNVRYAGFDFFTANSRVIGQLDRVLPIVPSAGVVIDF